MLAHQELWIRLIERGVIETMPGRNPVNLHGLFGLREEALWQTRMHTCFTRLADTKYAEDGKRSIQRWVQLTSPKIFEGMLANELGGMLTRALAIDAHSSVVDQGEWRRSVPAEGRFVKSALRVQQAIRELQHVRTLMMLGARASDTTQNAIDEEMERSQFQTLEKASGPFLDSWAAKFGISRKEFTTINHANIRLHENDEELRARIMQLKVVRGLLATAFEKDRDR